MKAESVMEKRRIAIVEDEPIIALDVKNTLLRLGYGLWGVVSSGEEFLRLAGGGRPDLALMDIKLSGKLDGIETALEIKRNFNIPIVYMTANADGPTVERARMTEPHGYISKPVKENDLFVAVETALERHRMETRLKESEERYRRLVENINEGVWMIDRNAVTVYANPRMAMMLGYGPEEMMGRHLFDFMDERGREIAASNIERRKENISEEHEFEFIKKDGARLHALLKTAALTDEQGEYDGALAAVTDITERVSMEAELRRGRAELLEAQKIARIGSWSFDTESRSYDWSPQMYALWGMDPDRPVPERDALLERVHPDDRPELERALDSALTRGESYEVSFRILLPDGRWAWHVSRGRPVFDRQGKVWRLFGTVQDVTEQRETGDLYRALAEKSLQGLVIIQDGGIVFANLALADMTGYSEHELLAMDGAAVREMVHPEDRERVWSGYRDRQEGGAPPDHYDMRLRRKDGSYTWVETYATIITYRGRIASQGVFIDISERKKLEQELTAKNEKLGTLVLELEAANEELQATNEEFETVNEDLIRSQNELIEANTTLAKTRDDLETVNMELKLSRDRYQSLFNSAGAAIFIHDLEGRFLEVNDAACGRLGYSRDELLAMTPMDIDAPGYAEVVPRRIEYLMEKGSVLLETAHKSRDGRVIPTELSARIIDYEGTPAIMSLARDISDRVEAKSLLERRLRYEEAVAHCSRELMADSPESLKAVLGRLRLATGADRVYFFENFTDAGGELRMRQACDSRGPGVPPRTESDRPAGLAYAESCPRWRDELSEGRTVSGLAEEFPPDERDLLREQSIQSLLALPVSVDGQWYGFIGFDDIREGRRWSDEDVYLLRTAAEMTGAYLSKCRAEDRLRATLHEREVLLKEIHHRVKNNFQVITSMLNLQSRSIKDEAVLQPFRESQNRIKAMALIHEKLYQSKNFSRIAFDDYIMSITRELHISYKNISSAVRIDVQAEKIELVLDQAIPCGLIVSELVSNAFKYAFPQGESGDNQVTIGLKSRGEEVALMVLDNGVGLPDGFDPKKTGTLGLSLVTLLVEQLKGNLEISGAGGAAFTLRFKKMNGGPPGGAPGRNE